MVLHGGDDPTAQALRDDVRLLGELLGETLRRQEGQALFERVERVRALAKRTPRVVGRRLRDADRASCGPCRSRRRCRSRAAFAHFLNLANVAEQHHRVRRRRAYQRDPRPGRSRVGRGSAAAAASGGIARRRSAPRRVRPAHRARRHRASDRDHAPHAAAQVPAHRRDAGRARSQPTSRCLERETLVETLRREITAAWETEEVRRERPSPLDEVRSALTVFEETLWDALPLYYRIARSHLAPVDGPRPAARRGADPFRIVDRR